jgi:type I restriction enzyme S subunit
MYFALSGLKETILQYGSIGATMANLSKGKFEELKILFPKEGLMENFSDLTKAFFDQIKNLSFKNQNLKQTRDLLLPRLISGELSVENLEVKI